jgi:uncharacterized protein YdeI (YjbR/CyaY-like superfamily)
MSASESEPKVPTDLRKALAAAPSIKALWNNLTPIGRWDFILWLDTAKQAETRRQRVETLCDMLAQGKRRPCCFPVVPFDLLDALRAAPKAKARWSGLSSIARRHFIAWIASAKQREMRRSRIEKACALLVTGRRIRLN